MDYIKILDKVKAKYDILIDKIGADCHFTGNFLENGEPEIINGDIDYIEWVASFYTGTALLLYSHYKDEKYLEYIKKMMPLFEKYMEISEEAMHHDGGFLYILYSVALYKLTGEKQYREMSIKAAYGLAARYMVNAHSIGGFGSPHSEKPIMIIDDMMNIQLLLWAYHETKNKYFKTIYEEHIGTVIKNFVRDDYSVRHACYVSRETGELVGERNWCGYSIGSWWSRGNAWLIFGLSNAVSDILADYKKDEYLLTLFENCKAYIGQLDETMIPRWDFRAPEGDNGVDTSAAAIVASAFYKLNRVNKSNIAVLKSFGLDGVLDGKLEEYADTMIKNIVEKYWENESEYFIINNSRSNNDYGFSLWGDYFLVEALIRKIHGEDAVDFWS